MATETRLEALRSLTVAIGIFALVAGLSFTWSAFESRQASAAHQTQATAALP